MRYKVFLIFIFYCFLYTSCTNDVPKKENEFILNGFLNEINTPIAYLYKESGMLIDSAKIIDNRFQFTGIQDTIQAYKIRFKDSPVAIDVFLENKPYFLYASPYTQKVVGGSIQNEFNTYNEYIQEIDNQKINALEIFQKDNKIEKLQSTLDSLDASKFAHQIASIKNSTFPPVKTFIFNKIPMEYLGLNALEQLKTIAQETRNKDWMLSIDERINKIQKEIELQLEQERLAKIEKEAVVKRQLAPMFVGESLAGTDLALRTVLQGKKAVLIDFWASWCGPCRQITPQVRSYYYRYKKLGFDIITVSEDKNRDAWRNGLAEDKILDWNHIYDDRMRIAYMFDVRSIPHMVLLDEKGGIINNKISLTQLDSELKKIFN